MKTFQTNEGATLQQKFQQLKKWYQGLSWRRKLAWAGALAAVFLVITPLASYAYYQGDISSRDRLMNRNNTGVVLLDRHGEPFFNFYQARHREEVTLDELDEWVVNALIAAEDRTFYDHPGFSPRAIAAATYANLMTREFYGYGGSTITQQLVKNVLLSPRKSYFRKYQEFFLALAIENRYSKDEILEMYLNSVYFGEGAFGVGAAAVTYFDKPASELTLAESSLLMAILPAPSALSPLSGDLEAAYERRAQVLEAMVAGGMIDNEAAEQAAAAELAFSPRPNDNNVHGTHFALMVIEQLRETYGEEFIARSGFTVTTTLDLDSQRQAEQYVRRRVEALEGSDVGNGALVAIESTSGVIRAMVGSKDYADQEVGRINMALAPRQTGSAIKPLYYAAALEQQTVTLASILDDRPTDFGAGFQPQNFDRRFRGNVTVRRALAHSLNVPSVEIMARLGLSNSISALERFGLELPDAEEHGLALALGTAEIPLIDMVSAYGALGNQGMRYEPTAVLAIHDKYGTLIHRHRQTAMRAISPEAAYLTSHALADEEARALLFGYIPINRPVAVKSGTTDDNRDAWVIGYTPSLAVGVWIGNNDRSPMAGVGGSFGAGPIWESAMRAFLSDTPAENFARPDSIVSAHICAADGSRAESAFPGTYQEVFIRGTLPRTACVQPVPEPEEAPADEDENERQERGRDDEEEEEDDDNDDDNDDDDDDNGQGGGPNGEGPPGQGNN